MSPRFGFVALLLSLPAWAGSLDFHDAVIVLAPNASAHEHKAATMLAEEIEKRTQLRLPIGNRTARRPAIMLAPGAQASPEGFTLTTTSEGEPPVARVSARRGRGMIFGAGYLLRQLRMGRQRLEVEAGLNVTTAPRVAIRGHQLGYRPKTNSYDGWTVPMWEQYIRELAIFGVNTIELIPPRSDDDADSPHFPLPQMEMMVEMSRIAAEYDLDVSIWYPAMDKDYADPKTVESAVREWGEVFRRLPRVDAVFVPGGDPGHTEPKYLLALLEKQAANLRRYHPKARVWVSPQSFSRVWMEQFYGILQTEPAWLAGVVFGPQIRDSLAALRERVPKRYPIRLYPDITHSLRSQYPVPDWDLAFALTEAREVINPRPAAEAAIFRLTRPLTNGFVTYSEGCNDDVNKFIWSALGWNPDIGPESVLMEYARFFIGESPAGPFARGLAALEQNWKGPLLANAGVDATLALFQELERTATPQLRANWRFQEALYRAYYDAFLRDRLTSETAQEQKAVTELKLAAGAGTAAALRVAQNTLDSDTLTARARQLRGRVFELAEALFQSIRMQLSVERYGALSLNRGASLDAIDFGLNNREWLKKRFTEIRALTSEGDRLARIKAIVDWTDPGRGGFYDELGNPQRSPHLARGQDYSSDPEFRSSPLIGFGGARPDQGSRTSWYRYAESLYDAPLRMRYSGLDPAARYRLRVVYSGDSMAVPIRLTANGAVVHDYRRKPDPIEPIEFDLPAESTRGGELTLEWTRPPGLGGNGRGTQVSEVWLTPVR